MLIKRPAQTEAGNGGWRASGGRRSRGGCGFAQFLERELNISFVFLLGSIDCGIFTSPFIFDGVLLYFFVALQGFVPLGCIFGVKKNKKQDCTIIPEPPRT